MGKQIEMILLFRFYVFVNKDLWQYRKTKNSLNLFNIEALLKIINVVSTYSGTLGITELSCMPLGKKINGHKRFSILIYIFIICT